jgi:putative heme iron utilization protein
VQYALVRFRATEPPLWPSRAAVNGTDEPKPKAMARPLTPEAIAKICAHMNDDHSDSLALYAKVFGKCEGALAARLRAFDADGMDLDVETAEGARRTRILFDHAIRDADDARVTLIAMAREAALA